MRRATGFAPDRRRWVPSVFGACGQIPASASPSQSSPVSPGAPTACRNTGSGPGRVTLYSHPRVTAVSTRTHLINGGAAPRAARRPSGKARRPRIPAVFEGGATPPGGMHRRPNAGPIYEMGSNVAQAFRPANGGKAALKGCATFNAATALKGCAFNAATCSKIPPVCAGSRVNVRSENPEDRGAIRLVHEAAFKGPDEADLVGRLHDEGVVLASLVAEWEQRIVGHILF